jgi:hypothetical protein
MFYFTVAATIRQLLIWVTYTVEERNILLLFSVERDGKGTQERRRKLIKVRRSQMKERKRAMKMQNISSPVTFQQAT